MCYETGATGSSKIFLSVHQIIRRQTRKTAILTVDNFGSSNGSKQLQRISNSETYFLTL